VSAEASVQLLSAAERVAAPWKNGGGITREIAVSPAGAGLGDFDWRVSTAEVRTAGPFSSFAGIDRTLCVLAGELLLAVHGRAGVVLAPDSAPFAFAADVAAHAEPRSPVVDLNVMTRRGRFEARVVQIEFGGTLLRELSAAITLVFALGPLELELRSARHSLGRWDALRLTGASACRFYAPAGRAGCYLIEIAAAPTP
jgi:environmental stress-induced protein Ves